MTNIWRFSEGRRLRSVIVAMVLISVGFFYLFAAAPALANPNSYSYYGYNGYLGNDTIYMSTGIPSGEDV